MQAISTLPPLWPGMPNFLHIPFLSLKVSTIDCAKYVLYPFLTHLAPYRRHD